MQRILRAAQPSSLRLSSSSNGAIATRLPRQMRLPAAATRCTWNVSTIAAFSCAPTVAPAAASVRCSALFHSSAIRRQQQQQQQDHPSSSSSNTSSSPSTASASAAPSASLSSASAASPPPPQASPQRGPASGRAAGGSGSGSSGGRSSKDRQRDKNATMLQYLLGVGALVLAASWAAVPLYRAFCAHTGYGGTTAQDKDGSKLASLKPGKREVVVSFNADVSPAMHWRFVPSQPQLRVRMGEPVLAFYKATNNLDKAVTGVATYNVTPLKVGAYFHKIQCFCFDEQRLRARETVDMPVFFYLDPAMEEDLRCQDVTHITLSYTFFPVDEDDDDDAASEEESEEDKNAAPGSGVKLHTHDGGPLPPQMAAMLKATPVSAPSADAAKPAETRK